MRTRGLNQPLDATDPATLNRWPSGLRPIAITAAPARPAVRLRLDTRIQNQKVTPIASN